MSQSQKQRHRVDRAQTNFGVVIRESTKNGNTSSWNAAGCRGVILPIGDYRELVSNR
jgi:hypothetical protein